MIVPSGLGAHLYVLDKRFGFLWLGRTEMTRRTMFAVAVVGMVAMLVGCKSGPAKPTSPLTGNPAEPLWVTQPEKAFPELARTSLFGMGHSHKDMNPSMTRGRSVERARTELGRAVQTHATSMVKDFMESHRDYADDSQGSIEFTQIVTKNVANTMISGAQLMNTWVDSMTGDCYTLLSISRENVRKSITMTARRVAAKKAPYDQKKTEAFLAELEKALGQ